MPRSVANEKHTSPTRDAVLGELADAASRVPTESLVPFLSVFGALGRDDARPRTAGVSRRVIGRMRVLSDYATLRADPANADASDRRVMLMAVSRADRVAPGLKCRLRTLQRWIADYNTIGPSGLAAAWAALLDRYGRPRKQN